MIKLKYSCEVEKQLYVSQVLPGTTSFPHQERNMPLIRWSKHGTFKESWGIESVSFPPIRSLHYFCDNVEDNCVFGDDDIIHQDILCGTAVVKWSNVSIPQYFQYCGLHFRILVWGQIFKKLPLSRASFSCAQLWDIPIQWHCQSLLEPSSELQGLLQGAEIQNSRHWKLQNHLPKHS